MVVQQKKYERELNYKRYFVKTVYNLEESCYKLGLRKTGVLYGEQLGQLKHKIREE